MTLSPTVIPKNIELDGVTLDKTAAGLAEVKDGGISAAKMDGGSYLKLLGTVTATGSESSLILSGLNLAAGTMLRVLVYTSNLATHGGSSLTINGSTTGGAGGGRTTSANTNNVYGIASSMPATFYSVNYNDGEATSFIDVGVNASNCQASMNQGSGSGTNNGARAMFAGQVNTGAPVTSIGITAGSPFASGDYIEVYEYA